ncbi:MAG: cupin domain-containing protein [Rhodocyclaceae bacterium]|nr:MAG: cupin domain-containing protein [Rhodocyclaceae bacterium]
MNPKNNQGDESLSSNSPTDEKTLLDVLADRLTPVMPPETQRQSLRNRLLERVADSAARHEGLITRRRGEGGWRKVKAGVAMKLLWSSEEGNSVLLRLDPGASLPEHRHRFVEEAVVLSGDLQMGQEVLGTGDYHVSPPGSRHRKSVSHEGCLAYVRGTSLGDERTVALEVISGLLPYQGPASATAAADGGEWSEIAPGVAHRILRSADGVLSRLVRMAPGSQVEAHAHERDEECMMLEGDAFLGDILLQAGDYQVAPAGTWHGLLHSDHGALLFVRGAAPCA